MIGQSKTVDNFISSLTHLMWSVLIVFTCSFLFSFFILCGLQHFPLSFHWIWVASAETCLPPGQNEHWYFQKKLFLIKNPPKHTNPKYPKNKRKKKKSEIDITICCCIFQHRKILIRQSFNYLSRWKKLPFLPSCWFQNSLSNNLKLQALKINCWGAWI